MPSVILNLYRKHPITTFYFIGVFLVAFASMLSAQSIIPPIALIGVSFILCALARAINRAINHAINDGY